MATWQHLRSSTANKRPTTSLADGRIAINTNTASPGLFFKDSAGTGIVKVGPVHVGTTAPNSVPAAGGSSGNYLGEQWLDTSVSPAQMKVWNGSTWIGVVADELPVSKLQDGAARQLIQTDAAGTGVEWTSNVDVPGTLDVTSTATFDSIAQYPLGSAGAPTITFTGDNNTGIYSPGADQVAISTGGSGRLFVDASGVITNSSSSYLAGSGENVLFSASNYRGLTLNTGTSTHRPTLSFRNASGAGAIAYIQGDEQALAFGRAGQDYGGHQESLRITSAGLVGVGTSVPQSQLHVLNQIRVSDSTQSQGSLVLGDGGSTAFNVGIARWNINTGSFGAGGIGYFSQGTGNTGGHYFYTGDAAVGSQTARMIITPAGLVGVGTSSPGTNLHIGSGAGGSDLGLLLSRGATTNFFEAHDGTKNFIAGTDSSNAFVKVGSLTNDPVAIVQSNAAAIYIDTSKRVGIGTTSPAVNAHIFGSQAALRIESSNTDARLQLTSSSGTWVVGNSVGGTGNYLSFYDVTASSERARIDSSGRLLVGTSSTSDSTKLLIQGNAVDPTGGAIINLCNGKATPVNGEATGIIRFSDNTHTEAATIISARDGGTWSGTSKPSRLVFSTTADGASSPTEAVRIDNGQNLMLSQSGSGIFVGTTTDGAFRIGRSSFAVSTGTLYIGNAAIQVSSDIRLKNNIEDTSLNALEAISKIKVKDFTWNDPTDTSYNNRNARGKWTGLIAQELVEVLPFVVNAPRKEEDGSIDYESQSTWTLDQSQLCPVLIKAVQQQQEIIAALEARVAALESA